MASFSVPPAERAARRIGSVLAGKYGIERVLGTGGMATVYMGVHRNGRRVAIKLLHEELGIHRDLRARFVREGYVANSVGHPGAVLVFDDDETEDGAAFLVMELLTGEALNERCKRRGGRLPCREVLALAHQLLDVLAAAHDKGIVHRDVKPENLFLTTSGALKVLDFGVARMRDDTGGSLATVTGARIGTPAFMPPEQALGRTNEIDARTDLWAVGATMFSLLAGRTVHVAVSAAELIVIAATTPPRSIAEFVPSLPAPVVALVDRAVKFAREDRWPDARAMQEALGAAHQEAFGEPLDPSATGPAPEPRFVAPKTEDDRETQPLSSGPYTPGRRMRAQATTTPAGPAAASAEDKGDAVSEPTWRSDRAALVDGAAAAKGDPTLSPATLKPRQSSPPPGTDTGADLGSPAQPRSKRRAWWPAAAAISLVATIGATYGVTRSLSRGGGDSGPGSGATPTFSAAPGDHGGCTRNVDCKGPVASICRKEDGVCVPLATDLCKVLASPGDVENDATVWVGAMFPISNPDLESYGPASANAVELARRDFVEATGGLPPARPGGPRRPIGIVLCDDRLTPAPAAEHLVRDLRVPAILGFALSKEVMELSSSLFLPTGTLALASNTSSSLRDIPHAPGEARLVWRVTTNNEMLFAPLTALLSTVVEPEVRSANAIPSAEPIRVAVLRLANATGVSIADGLIPLLRYNGKSVAENGDRFRQFPVAEDRNDDLSVEPAVAEQLRSFAPHVIVLAGPGTSVIPGIEEGWPRAAKHRPSYILGEANVHAPFVALVARDPALRRRFYSIDAALGSDALTKYVHHYNEAFTPPMSAAYATSAPYDAFYAFAYAAAALGEKPITGKALAAAISRLLPPGDPIDVGPAGIYKAFYSLAAGKNIDLQGAATTLDFDLETGGATVDMAIFCLTPPAPGAPSHPVESGLFFRARTGKLEGAMRCP